MLADLEEQLRVRQGEGLYRHRLTLSGAQGTSVLIEGRKYLSFCSNDYLGLANDPALIDAACDGARQYGVGSGASHLVIGHSAVHHQLEEALARFSGLPRALLFSTGYMANIAVVTALTGRSDAVFADRLNHASLNDAALLSRARLIRYPHGDLVALEQKLSASVARRKLVVTDAVFSMDGDIAPVPGLLALCEKYDAWLLLDDAHGFGVTGQQGSGTLSHFAVTSPRIIYMATLGKAAGVSGAFVAAQPVIIDTLIQYARSYIYTTAAPPLLSGVLLKSLEMIADGQQRREKLAQLVAGLKDQIGRQQLVKWKLLPSMTPVQPLIIGDNTEALELSTGLREQGILVPAIRPPTVPQGTARLRISLSAAHHMEDIVRLAVTLKQMETVLRKARNEPAY